MNPTDVDTVMTSLESNLERHHPSDLAIVEASRNVAKGIAFAGMLIADAIRSGKLSYRPPIQPKEG